jgi:protein-S-isoprenylcysteine O-methyltransferase Ste14
MSLSGRRSRGTVLAGLALNWLMPLPFIPAAVPAGWLGAMVFGLALALFAWAIATVTRAGSNVRTSLPTTTIVDTGPYRFMRNPIYLGMVLGLIGLAVALNSLWLLLTLVPFALVIRYGVVAREEAYLERKFGDVYRRYRAQCLPDDARGRSVRKMARVLKPGGPLRIVDFGGPVETSLLAHLLYHRHLDVHELLPALDAAGSERVGGRTACASARRSRR